MSEKVKHFFSEFIEKFSIICKLSLAVLKYMGGGIKKSRMIKKSVNLIDQILANAIFVRLVKTGNVMM